MQTKNKPKPFKCYLDCYGKDEDGICHVLKFPIEGKRCPFCQTRADRYEEQYKLYGRVRKDEWDNERDQRVR